MRYNENQKRDIVYKYHDGQKVVELCTQHNISKSTLYNWIHQYSEIKSRNGEIITPQRLHLLEKRIQRLIMELKIWEECKCTIDSPLSQKLEAIERLHKKYGVHACCRVLNVLRSTFYHHLLRKPEQTIIEKEDETYKPVIKKIFSDTKERIGSKKIRAIMVTQGYTISPE